MDPFVDLVVHPAYGEHLAVVSWKVQDQFLDGDFYVWKSPDGNRNWALLNSTPLQTTAFSDPHMTDTAFYRVLLEHRGESFDSPIVGIYDKLTVAEYRACRLMMNVEFNNMTKGRQGLRMLLYSPLKSGVLAPDIDAQTGQRFGAGLPSSPESDSYGERFVGGYSAPVITWVKLSVMAQMTVSDSQDKTATTIERDFQARILAFPIPNRGCLLVHPPTDNRYAIGETTSGYFFRGIIPTAFDIKMDSLYRTDPRYRVPVPHLDPELR